MAGTKTRVLSALCSCKGYFSKATEAINLFIGLGMMQLWQGR